MFRAMSIQNSMPNMIGRPGYRTMETNAGSSAPCLARTLCVPLFCTLFKGIETEGLSDYQGRAGIISIVRWNLRPVIFGVEKPITQTPKSTPPPPRSTSSATSTTSTPKPKLGRTPKGAYSPRGRSRHLLENPLLRTPSENSSQNPCLL